MSDDRELHALGRELFAAARTEGPEAVARDRVRSAVLQAYDRQDEVDDADEGDEFHQEPGGTATARGRDKRVWLLPAAAVVLAVAAGWVLMTVSARDHDRSIAPVQERVTDVPKRGPEPARSTPVVPPEKRLAPRPPVNSTPKPTSSAQSPPTLSDEVGMLDRARSELREKGPQRALELLDDYDRRAGSHLRDEATLLRIEALARSGREDEASKLAERFIASKPSSTLADRARGYLKSEEGKMAPK